MRRTYNTVGCRFDTSCHSLPPQSHPTVQCTQPSASALKRRAETVPCAERIGPRVRQKMNIDTATGNGRSEIRSELKGELETVHQQRGSKVQVNFSFALWWDFNISTLRGMEVHAEFKFQLCLISLDQSCRERLRLRTILNTIYTLHYTLYKLYIYINYKCLLCGVLKNTILDVRSQTSY